MRTTRLGFQIKIVSTEPESAQVLEHMEEFPEDSIARLEQEHILFTFMAQDAQQQMLKLRGDECRGRGV